MSLISQAISDAIAFSTPDVTEKLQSALDEPDWDLLMREVLAAIEQSKHGINRVTSIVRAMKQFSHDSPKEKENIVVSSIIETTVLISHNE